MPLSRRDFLKLSAFASLGLLLAPRRRRPLLPTFPTETPLGRVCVGGWVPALARPDADAPMTQRLYEDTVVTWQREVVGRNPYRLNQRFVETEYGFVWAPNLQPVFYRPNPPLTVFPDFAPNGFWAEVTVPYVDLVLANPPARSPWLKETPHPRLYYSQVMWVDQIRTDEQGQVWYRVGDRYGSYGDLFWVPAEALRPITPDEIAPISPEVENKRVVVNLTYQTLSCFEGNTEVYFCRISSGAMYNARGQRVDKWATPTGTFPIWRKLVSVHMSGGTTGGGYDLPGVAWTTLFVGEGIAIHATFWHNNYGEPMSHGCVNARPEDAKWIFRWTNPIVAYEPGDITVGMPGGTQVVVLEGPA